MKDWLTKGRLKMASENETVEEVLAEFGKNIELMRKCKCVGVSLWNCMKFKLRIEIAHKREVARLRESLSDAIELFCDTFTDNDEETGKCKDKDGVCPCVARWRNALKEGANK